MTIFARPRRLFSLVLVVLVAVRCCGIPCLTDTHSHPIRLRRRRVTGIQAVLGVRCPLSAPSLARVPWHGYGSCRGRRLVPWPAAFQAVVIVPIVRTLTKSCPSLDFVRTLTTFRPLRGRARRLPLWHGDLRQFCPFQNPSKTEQNRTKTDQNGHINRKNRSKTSAFCLTYLNIGSQKRPSRPRNGVPRQKKRAFRGFGNVKIDVSLMEHAVCVGGGTGRAGRFCQ